ncbi:MAG: N-glycosylase/DNA lyase [Elusimicrobiota bacterium]|jgi:N-glycosylase/DNA lyase|nr:N-glycosylase/DNA lyase [Elusimicrobiota bacterium]
MKNKIININFIETPKADIKNISDLQNYYRSIKHLIDARIAHWKKAWETASDEELFAELVFCLFTPQSKAVFCWQSVCALAEQGMLLKSNAAQIAKVINKVRFRNNKAKYLIEARKIFLDKGIPKMREKLNSFGNGALLRAWIVKNIKGIGYKEAGHFLRNIGLCMDLAVLDRHILKNLKLLGAISDIPASLSVKTYLDIEKQMKDFSNKIQIDMAALDIVLWCKESGGIFK